MIRDEYCAFPHIKSFSGFLGQYLDGKPFHHQYMHKKTERPWRCSSLDSAIRNYEWNGRNFEDTAIELEEFSRNLRKAVRGGDGDRRAANLVAIEIQEWGGTRKGNVKAIKDMGADFAKYLGICETAFVNDDKKKLVLNGFPLRSNAGFTKIYSLLLDEFCIYDSRVAAALGLFVRSYCEQAGLDVVPEALGFAQMSENNRKSDRRNPSNSAFQFPKTHNLASIHFRWNMRANWVLSIALLGTKFEEQYGKSSLRALEAALFMIGYDISA